jgi:hypothetical protein
MVQVLGNNRTSPGSNGSNVERPKYKENGGRRPRPGMVEMGKNEDRSQCERLKEV